MNEEQISLFDDEPTASFRLLGTLLRIEDGVRIISNDFYCSRCGKKLFHNGELLAKTKYCPYCNAKMILAENFKTEFMEEIDDGKLYRLPILQRP